MTARAETLVANQLFMAQAIDALADHVASSTGYALTPVAFSSLPATPATGMLAVVTDDSGPPTWGSTVSGGGSSLVLAWYNGVAWTVVGK
jgi:hypothetical protein